MATELTQIYYREEQRSKIYSFSIPYFNPDLTIFFENKPISEVVTASEAEKIGVCSWKLQEKLKERVGTRQGITLEAISGNYEVLSFTRNSKRHRMIAMAAQWHPDFMETLTKLWNKLGHTGILKEPKDPIYKNSFMARGDIYKRYVSEFLNPAMELINTDEELNILMNKPSKYGSFCKTADLKAVKDKLGMTDYPLCPFVLERCPSIWFDKHNINVSYL